jgi:cytoskeletal protein RodZ
MNSKNLWLTLIVGLLGCLLVIGAVAQQTPQSPSQPAASPSQQSPSSPSQTPGQQPSQTPGQTPDQSAQPGANSQTPSGGQDQGQTFAGTIVKQGDKYVLQDASGKSYEVEPQTDMKKYEGKQVRIMGTLDPDGKTIHVK